MGAVPRRRLTEPAGDSSSPPSPIIRPHQHGIKVEGEEEEQLHIVPPSSPVPILSIFIYTTLMALASGLGVIPFFIFGRLQDYWAGIANAVAVGVMLSASFDLLHEGAPYSPMLTIAGMIIGALFIKASQDYLSKARGEEEALGRLFPAPSAWPPSVSTRTDYSPNSSQ